ncbi:MAG TPA: hypothetical protein PKL25_05055 [Phycicoccus elongatus]|nr:hypothetical protein [Phycicoccus elongatus]
MSTRVADRIATGSGADRIATGSGADRQITLGAFAEQLICEANAVLDA